MSRKRKYKRGLAFQDMTSLDRWIRMGRWVYLRDKVMHPSWVSNMTFATVSLFLRNMQISMAVKNDD